MVIQDFILTVGSIVLIAALIPSILSRHKPALTTSLMMSAVLFTFAGVYGSLELWLAMIATASQAALWLVLAFQKKRRKPMKRKNSHRKNPT